MMTVSPFLSPSAPSMPCSAVSPVVAIAPACSRSRRMGRHLCGRDGDISRIEAALRIGPAVGVDLFSKLETADPRADRGDHPGSVGAEDEREARLPARIPAGADLRIPGADA